jgi:DNA-binding MarR family transcriptional regulator
VPTNRPASTQFAPEMAPEEAARLARSLDRLFFAFRKWNFRKWNSGVSGGSVIRLYLLERLATSGEPWRMSDLAVSLGVSGRMMTSLVDSLEGEGLVRRRSHPTDRRAMLVELVARPEDALAPLVAYHIEAGSLFDGVDRADREAFLRVADYLARQTQPPEEGESEVAADDVGAG